MTKLEAYKAGHYMFPAPPVCSFYWNDDDWIRYIDSCGKWTVEIKNE